MKLINKAILQILLLFLVSNSVIAQFYIKPYIGYYLPYGGGNTEDNFIKDGVYGGPIQKATMQTVSYGSGTTIGIGGGYMFTNNLGLEQSISTTYGNKFYSHYTSKYNKYNLPYRNGNFDNYEELTSNGSIDYSTNLVLSTDNWKIKPYARCGIFISTNGKIIIKSNSMNTDTAGKKSYLYDEAEITHYPDFGFCGSFGCKYPITKNLNVGLEFYYQNITRYLKHWIMTKYTIDGIDNLGTIKRWEKETDYSKTQYRSSTLINPVIPYPDRSWSNSFSSYGLNFTLIYTIPKTSFKLK
ncbi:MAG: hypothetical protein NTX03_03955 [Bacteroidetes bacterium]|nr:hypothetical protein [Bacteroidota bacterium]